jgi:hypothetical protein
VAKCRGPRSPKDAPAGDAGTPSGLFPAPSSQCEEDIVDKLHFDDFQKVLAKKLSRRTALAGLAGTGMAATVTLAGAGEARGETE